MGGRSLNRSKPKPQNVERRTRNVRQDSPTDIALRFDAKRFTLRVSPIGGMAEWSMAVVLKTTVPGRVPGVRIPLPPPNQ